MKKGIFLFVIVFSTVSAKITYYVSSHGYQNDVLFALGLALPLHTVPLEISSKIKINSYCECKNVCLEREDCAIASFYTENAKTKCVLTGTALDRLNLRRRPEGRIVAKLSKTVRFFGDDGQFYLGTKDHHSLLKVQEYCKNLPGGNMLMIKKPLAKSAALAFVREKIAPSGHAFIDLKMQTDGSFLWGDGTVTTAADMSTLFTYSSKIAQGMDLAAHWTATDTNMELQAQSLSAGICQLNPLHQFTRPADREITNEIKM